MTSRNRHNRKYTKDYTAFARVIALTEPFNEHELRELLLPIRESFEALRTGRATERDVSDLSSVINTTVMRTADIHPTALEAANTASRALIRVVERYQRTHRWGLDGPGIAELEVGIDLHEQLCRLSTPRQMREAALKAQQMRIEHESRAKSAEAVA